MIEVAKATVTIIPNMQGAQQQITKDLTGASTEAASKAGEKGGKSWSDGFKKAAAAATATVAAISAAAVAATKAFVDSAKETAAYGDEIDKNSQKLGVSAATYQKLDYAMQRSGTTIDVVKKGLLKINTAIVDTANGADDADDAYNHLGISLKNMDGTMKSSEQVLLATIDKLAAMEDETERDVLAQQLFGKSAMELGPLLNSGSEAIKGMMQEAEDYGMVMSDDAVSASAGFQDSLLRLQNTMQGVTNNFLATMLPGMSDIMDGFSDMIAGVDGGGEKMKNGISSIITAFQDNLPMLLEIVTNVAISIIEALPDIVSQILEVLPSLFESVLGCIETLIMSIANEETIGLLIDTILSLVISLINNLDKIILPIIKAIPVIVVTIIEKILENLPTIIEGIINLVLGIVAAIPEIIKYILDKLPEIISMVIDTLMTLIPQLVVGIAKLVAGVFSAVGQILASLWDFLKNAVTSVANWLGGIWGTYIAPFFANLWNNITTWFSNLWTKVSDWFKNLFTKLGEGLKSVWTKIGTWFSDTFQNIGKWLGNFWTKIGDWFKSLPGKLGDAFKSVWNWLKEKWNQFVEWGGNLVQGIWQGISNGFNWIKEKIQGWVGNVLGFIKRLFGIGSPSKLFRDEVGVFLAEGLGEGFVDEMDEVAEDMTDAVPTSFDTEVNETINAGRGLAVSGLADEMSYGGLSISMTVNGAEGQDVNQLADVIMDKIQAATTRKKVAYGL